MPKRIMVNTRTGERREVEIPPSRYRSPGEGGPLAPFAPRDGEPTMDYDELPLSAALGGPGEHSDIGKLEGMGSPVPWGNPDVTAPGFSKVTIDTLSHVGGPTDGNGSGGGGTEPDLQTANRLYKDGPFTSSIVVMLKATANGPAVANAGGFTVTVWLRDRNTHFWGVTTAFSADYGELFGTGDFNGGELFFQIGNVAADGNIIVLALEQF